MSYLIEVAEALEGPVVVYAQTLFPYFAGGYVATIVLALVIAYWLARS